MHSRLIAILILFFPNVVWGADSEPNIQKILPNGKIIELSVQDDEIRSSPESSRACHWVKFSDSEINPQWILQKEEGEIESIRVNPGSVELCVYTKNNVLRADSKVKNKNVSFYYLINEGEAGPVFLISENCKDENIRVEGKLNGDYSVATLNCSPAKKSDSGEVEGVKLELKTSAKLGSKNLGPVWIAPGKTLQMDGLQVSLKPNEVISPDDGIDFYTGFRAYLGWSTHKHQNNFDLASDEQVWKGSQTRFQLDGRLKTEFFPESYFFGNVRGDFFNAQLFTEIHWTAGLEKQIFKWERSALNVGLGASSTYLIGTQNYGFTGGVPPLLQVLWASRRKTEIKFNYVPLSPFTFELTSALYELTLIQSIFAGDQHFELGAAFNYIHLSPSVTSSSKKAVVPYTFRSFGASFLIGWRFF